MTYVFDLHRTQGKRRWGPFPRFQRACAAADATTFRRRPTDSPGCGNASDRSKPSTVPHFTQAMIKGSGMPVDRLRPKIHVPPWS